METNQSSVTHNNVSVVLKKSRQASKVRSALACECAPATDPTLAPVPPGVCMSRSSALPATSSPVHTTQTYTRKLVLYDMVRALSRSDTSVSSALPPSCCNTTLVAGLYMDTHSVVNTASKHDASTKAASSASSSTLLRLGAAADVAFVPVRCKLDRQRRSNQHPPHGTRALHAQLLVNASKPQLAFHRHRRQR